MEETIAKYETDIAELEKRRKEILKTAKEEAEKVLRESNAKIENTIRTIKEAQADKEKTRNARQELTDFKSSLEEFDSKAVDENIEKKMQKLREKQQRKENNKKNKQNKETEQKVIRPKVKPIEVGSTVRIKGQTTVGKVLEMGAKSSIVMFGMIKTNVKTENLEHALEPVKNDKPIAKSTFVSSETQDRIYEKKLNFKQDIDVRGMRGDEAMNAVTYFIDDAVLLGIRRVRILHGTGTGILRTLIRDYLSTVPGVAHFQDEHVQFGGAGITVVDLE
jgi:DNA mismatch repair protein MutS2